MAKKKTHEEYVAELAEKNPDIEVIGEYINAKTKILHHCLLHDVYWYITPDSALNKASGCPECAKEKFHFATTKTRDEYIAELNEKNPNLELIGEYLGSKVSTTHLCKTHNVIFDTTPDTAFRGGGCQYCKIDKMRVSKLKTEEQYIAELAEKNQSVKLVGKYIDSLTPTEHVCLIHNVVWETTPARALYGAGCSQCRSEKISNRLLKSRDEYISELAEANPDVILIGEYINNLTPTEHYCKKHSESFFGSPASALKGRGCQQCGGSKGEKYVGKWLAEHDITYMSQKSFDDCKDKHTLLFDFYLPDYNCCIEYNGKQHYEPVDYFGGQESLEHTQKHDRMKAEYCKSNDIRLLSIPYYKDIDEELNNFLFI